MEHVKITRQLIRLTWIVAGVVFVVFGVVGIVLPLLPTTPFLLLAAYCFARGSERLNNWLLSHPQLGPPIANWQKHGAISIRAKKLALLFIIITPFVTYLFGVPLWAFIVQAMILSAVALFIVTRPLPPS